uniref:Voltage-dependent anion-selective channel protein 2 n=1 Tax=Phallusia mammillata TaxID=59560 RepID=A0A6F9DXA7_9ASCI|nr:voltage-dependent anion-selective channel protein 2 [Phallusia mammillata]
MQDISDINKETL